MICIANRPKDCVFVIAFHNPKIKPRLPTDALDVAHLYIMLRLALWSCPSSMRPLDIAKIHQYLTQLLKTWGGIVVADRGAWNNDPD